MPRHGWCLCCVDLGLTERYRRQMESHRSYHSRLRLCWQLSGYAPIQGGSSIREDFRGNEELSDVAAFSSGPSPHEDCLAEDTFVDDVRGDVLETERVKQGSGEEVQQCRGMGVWERVFRKDIDAEDAKALCLRCIDTSRRL